MPQFLPLRNAITPKVVQRGQCRGRPAPPRPAAQQAPPSEMSLLTSKPVAFMLAASLCSAKVRILIECVIISVLLDY